MSTTKINTAYFVGAFLGHASERVTICGPGDTATVDALSSMAGEIAALRAQVEALCGHLEAAGGRRSADSPTCSPVPGRRCPDTGLTASRECPTKNGACHVS